MDENFSIDQKANSAAFNGQLMKDPLKQFLISLLPREYNLLIIEY